MSNMEPVPSKELMWRAYAYAPAVTPLVFSALLFPAGVVLPIHVIAGGFLTCYLVAGLLGMPIAFCLRRKNALNGFTIQGAAFLWGLFCSILSTYVLVYITVAIGGSIQSLPFLFFMLSALIVTPVVLAGTAFWMLLRNPQLV